LAFPEISNQGYTKSSAQILITVCRCLFNYTVYNKYVVSNDTIVTFEVKRVYKELAMVYFTVVVIAFALSGWKKPRTIQASCLGFNRECY
jgi:hypothetical protein